MPKIPTLPKKQRNSITKDEKYKARRKVYDSQKWKDLRQLQLMKQPLCRCCTLLGKVTAGECVHHIYQIGNAKSFQEVSKIGYDSDNLVTLCEHHHSMLHSLDEFKNREYKRAEDLAEWIKDHPDINNKLFKEYIDDERDLEKN